MNESTRRATAGQDTIAAIATPPGTSGIAVVRVSGDRAITAVGAFFRGQDLASAATHTVHHGSVVDADGAMIDDVLVTVFREPRSYTGEDSVEISCHGGGVVSRRVLQRALQENIRHAEPGEFTRRAFLNGKMDLAQAEAVADLIHAQSEEAHRASLRQLEGALSQFVGAIRERLTRAAGMLELSLDFVEEDVAFLTPEQLRSLLLDAAQELVQALQSYRSGRLIRDGVRIALFGPPNVGKSSLLNALLGMRRAIVTDTPGTTRDYIEEQMLLHGEFVRFIDTAGLRETADGIEREGMSFSRDALRSADIVCLVLDAREGADEGVLHRELQAAAGPDAAVLSVYNKADLVSEDAITALRERGAVISALVGDGMQDLTVRLAAMARGIAAPTEQGGVLVTNARHADCLRRGIDAIEKAVNAQEEGMTEEFIAYELRGAIDALGEIIGVLTSEDVLNSVFSRFCIGK